MKMTETITVNGVGAVAETSPAMTALELKRAAQIEKEEQEQKELEEAIPKPTGYHVLIALPNVEETFGDSGLVKASSTVREEYILSTIGLVLDMGDQAYNDKDRFPTGPWCKTGDYVMFRANTGTRFKLGKQEYRLMNDDSIQAVVPNPRMISRA
jgi:co-chaperonin GroES (HSP10)|uniref:Co-chaperonin GroES n=1 Tax=uncultured virus TaxID=340016 RepID=A0A221S2H3_9VIRU|nr:co-chaperonin GroES [uncultured virus]